MFASISHPGGVLKGVLEANGFLLGLTFRKPVFGPSKNVVKRNYFHVLLKKSTNSIFADSLLFWWCVGFYWCVSHSNIFSFYHLTGLCIGSYSNVFSFYHLTGLCIECIFVWVQYIWLATLKVCQAFPHHLFVNWLLTNITVIIFTIYNQSKNAVTSKALLNYGFYIQQQAITSKPTKRTKSFFLFFSTLFRSTYHQC